ncbi:hypothetical protein [Parasphingorhabdus sp.]|uniref:hypothetical protein n=1 Tax=Parasphingorhabdus sp. TaxID=2709688 RepID=UPI003A94FEFE
MAFWSLILIAVLALLLLGQIMAQWGDACLAVADPRPIGGKTIEITILAWGFASRRGRSLQADDCYRLGINDMRFFMTGQAILICVVTLGFVRKISIAYRCYAGDFDVGEA